MFTGLVQEVGRVLEQRMAGHQCQFKIQAATAEIMGLGDSVAVNGVCLTVIRKGKGWFEADVMPRTLQDTNLKYLKLRDYVNLEPALKMGDSLGGHLVTGHVDGVGRLLGMRRERNAVLVKVGMAEKLLDYIVMKGSIALDGVSLTVQDVERNAVVVSIIPHTFRQTRFQYLKLGDYLNIETDMLMKRQSEKEKGPAKNGITLEFLKEHGYWK
ncbi:MAG TPA: riboflavin synthase [Bacillota bacterium]|nr:riboflavin synthase [Bacillota bacterium]